MILFKILLGNPLVRLLEKDRLLIWVILINSLVLILQGVESVKPYEVLLERIDIVCTFIFLSEMIVKMYNWGAKNYFKSGWNKLDFILVIIALPSVMSLFFQHEWHSLDFLLMFRTLRVLKFLRFLRFIPDVDRTLAGIVRALNASLVVMIGFFGFMVCISVVNVHFFGHLAPELFGDSLTASYTTFKVFTVEGWYEIPDTLAQRTQIAWMAGVIRFYFVIVLLGGGIIGLSLVNSVFVDAMMEDNNDELLKKVQILEEKVVELNEEIVGLREQLSEQQQITKKMLEKIDAMHLLLENRNN